jgi:glutamate dehydrogenase (NAD(P)+)
VLAGAVTAEQALAPLLRDMGAIVAEQVATAPLARECDILVLGAQVPVLGAAEAAGVQAELVVEAGGAVDVEADAVLEARGATVIPDVLSGAGQVAASYFEWVQGLQQFLWSSREVHAQLDRVAADAARQALQVAGQRRVSLRAGALVLAVGRVVEAIAARGIYP